MYEVSHKGFVIGKMNKESLNLWLLKRRPKFQVELILAAINKSNLYDANDLYIKKVGYEA